VSKDSGQTETAPRKFKLGPLGTLNQVTKGLAKTIRAMADGTVDSQVGADCVAKVQNYRVMIFWL
jgi:hypothetical protein